MAIQTINPLKILESISFGNCSGNTNPGWTLLSDVSESIAISFLADECGYIVETEPNVIYQTTLFIPNSEKIITTTGSGFTANLTCKFKSRLIPRVDPVPFSVTAVVTNQSPVSISPETVKTSIETSSGYSGYVTLGEEVTIRFESIAGLTKGFYIYNCHAFNDKLSTSGAEIRYSR